MNGLFRKLRSATRRPSGVSAVDDELIVDLAIKEFYQLREQGCDLSPTEYAKQYPAAIKSLLLTDLQFEESLCELDATGVIDESSSSGGSSSWSQRLLQSDDEMTWPQVGDKAGKLTLLEQIGGGKFSRVFAASSGPDGPELAIKFCRRQGNHEARTLGEVTHSAIGVVDGVETVPETDLIAIRMPLKSRTTLADVLRSVARSGVIPTSAGIVWDEVQSRNKLIASPPAWACKSYIVWAQHVMSTLAEALSAAHSQSTAHCDIKPPNVLVNAEGSPILIDFNLSLRWDVESSSPNIGGTLPYMAPEQLQAFGTKQQGDIGPRTDIYGLAATIYQLLTGELPFESPPSGSISETLKLRKIRPRSIRVKNPHIPPAFACVIMKCLNYHPKDRPRTAADLVAQLNQVATAPGNSHARRLRAFATAAVAVVMFALTLATAYPPGSSPQLPDLAITSPYPNAVAAVEPVVTPEQEIADLLQLLDDGYDEYEAGDYESAAATFMNVLTIDSGHDGAAIGHARSQFQLGDYEAAAIMMATRIPNDGSPESEAVQGLRFATSAEYVLAIPFFTRARKAGLATREVLTNLGGCLSQIGQHEDAIEVLERVRDMGGDTSMANLLLARTYPRIWRLRVNGKLIHQYDTDLLVRLINNSTPSSARSLTATLSYTTLALRFGRDDKDVKAYWARQALEEYTQGCELGLDPNYWSTVKRVLPESATPPSGVEPSDVPVPRKREFFLLEPLGGTRLDRCKERDLRHSHS